MSDPATVAPAPEQSPVPADIVPAVETTPEPTPVAPVEAPASAPIPEPVVASSPAIMTTGPHDVLIDTWFADHFSDQVFSREGSIWPQAYAAKEHLKTVLKDSNVPVFDGLIDQWFWDSFSNSEFSHDVTTWNVAYEAKQRLKFLFATR